MDQPLLVADQNIQSSVAAKSFRAVRQQVHKAPVVILDNGVPGSVLLNYPEFEQMVLRLHELEEKLLAEKIERAEADSSSIVPVHVFFDSLKES